MPFEVRYDDSTRADAAEGEVAYREDYVPLPAPTRTSAGFLEAYGVISRTGVQAYRRADGTEVRELRPADEVFRPETLASFEGAILTLGHPADLSPETAARHAVGTISAPARRDAGEVEVTTAKIRIHRLDAIQAAEDGTRGLSAGYTTRVVARSGEIVHPDGRRERFDAVQTQIEGDHVALVDHPRAGPIARLRLDAASAVIDGQESTTMLIVIGGRAYEVPSEVGAQMRADGVEALTPPPAPDAPPAPEVVRLQAERDALKARLDEREAASAQGAEHKRLAEAIKATLQTAITAAPILGVRADSEAFIALLDLEPDAIRRQALAKMRPNMRLDDRDAVYVEAFYDAVRGDWVAPEQAASAVTRGLESSREDAQGPLARYYKEAAEGAAQIEQRFGARGGAQ